MKIWVVVNNYSLINDDVAVFKTYKDAKQAFKKYTGFEYDPKGKYKDSDNREYSEYYEQCDIFKGEI